jgi:hypothetical protein
MLMPNRDKDGRRDESIYRLAQSFTYPPTPDISTAARRSIRRSAHRPYHLAWSLAAVITLALLVTLLFSSPARARVVEWLRIGAVRIFPVDSDVPFVPPRSPDASRDLLALEGEIPLATAIEKARFDLKIPLELGEPDRVYYQEIERVRMVVMLWLDREQGNLALYQIHGPVSIVNKRYVGEITETTVAGEWALWVEGPYQLYIESGTEIDIRTVEGKTLLWQQDEVTYRFESDLVLEEALEIAESLQTMLP